MPELPNFPMVSQLADTTEINAQFDCVPTSIAAGLEYLTHQKFTGAQVKDAVYGKSYQGPTNMGTFVDYCQNVGVKLEAISGTGPQLISVIKQCITEGWPVLGTEPDPYADRSLRWTHVIIFYGFDEGANTLTAMDPFIAKPVTKKTDEWATLLQAGEVCAMKEAHMGGIPKGWSDDGKALHASGTSNVVMLGFRDYILNNHWNPNDIPLENELHASPLIVSDPGRGAGQRQRFAYSTLGYTEKEGVFLIANNQEIIAYEQKINSFIQGFQALAASIRPYL